MDKNFMHFTFVVLIGVLLLLVSIISILPASLYIISSILALIGLVVCVIAFSSRSFLYIFKPFMNMKKNTMTLSTEDPFYVSVGGATIISKEDDQVYATAFVKIPIYKSATEMSDDEKLSFASLFSRVLTVSKSTFRLSTQLHVIDKDAYIKKITQRLIDVEDKYNRLVNEKSTPKNELDRISGEVTMWHNLFDSVSKANSQAQVAYAVVSSIGGNEEEATNLAVQQAEEVAAGISTVYGISATLARGNEILMFVEPDHMVPPTTVAEMMRREQKA